MNHYLRIQPRDPLIARDGRPFGLNQGNRMKGIAWPYPSLLAGSFRSALYKQVPEGASEEQRKAILMTPVAGPFPLVNDQLFLPAPHDAVQDKANLYSCRPAAYAENEGTDLPSCLEPVMLPTSVKEGSKPIALPPWWSLPKLTQWLMEPHPIWESLDNDKSSDFLKLPAIQDRVHVEISPENLAARDERLFATSGMELDGKTPWELAARVGCESSPKLDFVDQLQPLGGERRLVHWRLDSDQARLWKCPDKIHQALGENGEYVRMMLATPGVFLRGWRPGWLENIRDQWIGVVPGTGVRVQLVGACIHRWQAVSGYYYQAGKRKFRTEPGQPLVLTTKPGPKPIRRLVPAGSVFFFKTLDGNPKSDLAKAWLQSVCDLGQDRDEGFGLAVWGVWQPHQ